MSTASRRGKPMSTASRQRVSIVGARQRDYERSERGGKPMSAASVEARR